VVSFFEDNGKGLCMKFKLVLIILNLLMILSVYAEKPISVQYISPLDQSELNSRSSQIIIRQGDAINPSTLNTDLFTVIGDKSGRHSGEVIISSDGKTIIFKPVSKYAPGEQISVLFSAGLKLQNGNTVPPFDFSFKVTPLEKPLNPADYKEELNLFRLPEDLRNTTLQKPALSDSLPQDFPTFTVEVNDTTSSGDYFFSPTRIVSGDGYNVIVSNTGELKYYEKINEGVPFDFKVASNSMLTFGIMSEFYEFGGGGDTQFFMMDSSFSIVKQFQMGNGYTSDFHEFQYLPNGHVFMVAYDLQPVDMSELVEGGHPGALVAGSVIQELDLNGNVIFQWRSWDHYSLFDSYADLTQSIFDAIHINSIELDLSDLNIIISTLALAEATKINRQTGEIIWRMGGQNNQFTFQNESQEHAPLYFMFQHEIRRLKNGNITMFDGGDTERRKYSRAVEFAIDEVNKTATKVWEYRKSPDIYSPNMGSVQRLENGNTVIGWGLASMTPGQPMITEVDPQGNVVYELSFDKPLTTSYRAMKYDWDGGYPAADVLVAEVLAGNTYEFNEEDQETGVSLNIIQHDGFGYNEIIVKRYEYGPLSPFFISKAPVLEQTRIVVDEFLIDRQSFQADIMFDVDFYGLDNPDSVIVYQREFEGSGLFIALPTQFNPATNKIVSTMTRFGEFILAYPDINKEIFPPLPVRPRDGQMVDQTKAITLEWSPVGYTNKFSLEVATDENFNEKVIEEQSLNSAIYTIGSVEPNSEYFWRVKASNNVGESEWSQMTSFETTEPYISLLSPEAGAKWRIGLEYFITWKDNLTEDVILELSLNDTLIMTIDTTASTGGYKWNIPLFLDVGDHYKIRIRSVENAEINDISAGEFSIIEYEEPEPPPKENVLYQNFPNPFNPSSENTQITYQTRESGKVVLKVFNILGSVISTLVNEEQGADTYTIDFSGNGLASGIYIYTLQVRGKLISTKKMLIVK
jgi:hypothetical protein